MPSLIRRRELKSGAVRWQVRVPIGEDADGNQQFIRDTFETEKGAKIFLGKILEERDEGRAVKPTNITLEKYLKDWLETAARSSLRENTFRNYSHTIKHYIIPRLGNRKLKKLTPMMIQRRLNTDMLNGGLSVRTVRLTHSILHGALRQAVEWRILKINPADGVSLPKKQETEMTPLTTEEAKQFLEAAKGDRLEAWFHLALSAGMRPSEIIGLKWECLDLDAGQVKIVRVLVRDEKGWHLRDPKTKKGRRTIPLPSQTIDVLRAHKRRQAEERMKAGWVWTDHGFAFTTLPGEPLTRDNIVKRNFARICEAIGLGVAVPTGKVYKKGPKKGEPKTRFKPSVRLYDLRHTCATIMLAGNIHPKVASERLGHSSVAITLDTYSHVLPTMQDEATAKIAGALYE